MQDSISTTPSITAAAVAARAQYLEQQCLLLELQHMVASLQFNTSKELAAGRAAPSPAAVASLAKHLQAASLVQQVQLPAVQQRHHNPFSALHATSNDTSTLKDAAGPHEELLGSKQHVLGVTPQQLRRLYLPSRKAAQRVHAPLLPLLETQLKQHAQEAVSAILGSPADTEAAGSQALHKVADTQAELSALQRSNMLQLQQLHKEAGAYLGDLDAIHALLQQLVGKCMVDEQPKIEQVNREWTQTSMHSCVSKLHLMQLQLWSDTYDARNTQALAEISREQQQMEQQLRSAIQQAESQLVEYQQLGPEFDAIVQDYADVLAGIDRVDRTLGYMAALAAEVAADRPHGDDGSP